MDLGAAKTIGQIAFGLWPTYGMHDPKNQKGSSPMDIGAAKAIGSIVLDFVGFLVPSTQKSKNIKSPTQCMLVQQKLLG